MKIGEDLTVALLLATVNVLVFGKKDNKKNVATFIATFVACAVAGGLR